MENRMAGWAVSYPSIKKGKSKSSKKYKNQPNEYSSMMMGDDFNQLYGVTSGKRKNKGNDQAFGRDPNQKTDATADSDFGVDQNAATTTNTTTTTNETINNNYSIDIPDAQQFNAMPQYQQRSFGKSSGNAGFNFRDTIDFSSGMER